jgi:hypothetical protein
METSRASRRSRRGVPGPHRDLLAADRRLGCWYHAPMSIRDAASIHLPRVVTALSIRRRGERYPSCMQCNLHIDGILRKDVRPSPPIGAKHRAGVTTTRPNRGIKREHGSESRTHGRQTARPYLRSRPWPSACFVRILRREHQCVPPRSPSVRVTPPSWRKNNVAHVSGTLVVIAVSRRY